MDIPAPKGTPAIAAAHGTVEALVEGPAGGIGVFLRDESGKRCLYYAHLSGYVDGLRARQTIRRGDIVGYVGSTGNASPDGPHLHFAVYEQEEPSGPCSTDRPVNPFSLLSARR